VSSILSQGGFSMRPEYSAAAYNRTITRKVKWTSRS
jgi:hypothetical protein